MKIAALVLAWWFLLPPDGSAYYARPATVAGPFRDKSECELVRSYVLGFSPTHCWWDGKP